MGTVHWELWGYCSDDVTVDRQLIVNQSEFILGLAVQ